MPRGRGRRAGSTTTAGFYGHGDVAGLGFKIAPDFPSDRVDPDTLDRIALPSRREEARDYAAVRFPGLAAAPVIGARVCQYDLTPDTHFVVARHPENASWWLVGGGSGHGFKHGPALGGLHRRLHRGTARTRAVPRPGTARRRRRPAHRQGLATATPSA